MLNLNEIADRAAKAVALANSATPGPWLAATDDFSDVIVYTDPEGWVANVGDWGRQAEAWDEEKLKYDDEKHRFICDPDTKDAAFIADARTSVVLMGADIEALVARILELEAEKKTVWNLLDRTPCGDTIRDTLGLHGDEDANAD